MNELKCPKCGTTFKIDETNYDSILKQVRNHEFDKEIELREKQFSLDKENAIKLAEVNTEKKLLEEINRLKLEIKTLENELTIKEEKNKLELEKAVGESKKEVNDLKNKIELDKKEYMLKEQSIKDSFNFTIKQKDEMIEYYKDMKTSLSTKMVGESSFLCLVAVVSFSFFISNIIDIISTPSSS